RLGCKIIHGPNINNFRDIYKLLQKLNISKRVNTNKNLTNNIRKNIQAKLSSDSIIKKIELMGIKIKELTLKELNQTFN